MTTWLAYPTLSAIFIIVILFIALSVALAAYVLLYTQANRDAATSTAIQELLNAITTIALLNIMLTE